MKDVCARRYERTWPTVWLAAAVGSLSLSRSSIIPTCGAAGQIERRSLGDA